MGSILKEVTKVRFEDEFYEDEDVYFVSKASQWLVDGNTFFPSIDVKVQKHLSPGMYRIETRIDRGLCATKLEETSDELFTLNDNIIKSLLEEIDSFWSKTDFFKANNLLHKRGILLEGAPGNGKTSLITLLVREVVKRGGVAFLVERPSDLGLYINFVLNDFRSIQPDTPVITIIEDLDKYTETYMLLDFLDGKTSIEHHVILFTSNNTQQVPDPFLRPSRIDIRVLVDFPQVEEIKKYYTFKKVPEESLNEISEKSLGLSMADLKEVYISVYILGYTIDESIKRVKAPIKRNNYMYGKNKKSLNSQL